MMGRRLLTSKHGRVTAAPDPVRDDKDPLRKVGWRVPVRRQRHDVTRYVAGTRCQEPVTRQPTGDLGHDDEGAGTASRGTEPRPLQRPDQAGTILGIH